MKQVITIYAEVFGDRFFLVSGGFMVKFLSKHMMIPLEEFKKLDLKIAEIVQAEPHPNADRLWVLKIRVGSEERQIVAGIRKFYASDQLVGKKIVLVANLEPATIRGVQSDGMLLAASSPEGSVVLLVPEKDIPSGSVVK